jgi:YD repeat-containing protein
MLQWPWGRLVRSWIFAFSKIWPSIGRHPVVGDIHSRVAQPTCVRLIRIELSRRAIWIGHHTALLILGVVLLHLSATLHAEVEVVGWKCYSGGTVSSGGSSEYNPGFCDPVYADVGGGGGGGYGGGGVNVGGGGTAAPNPGNSPNQKRDAYIKTKCDQSGSPQAAGNPVVFSTGNKIEPEVDFRSGGDMPLTLNRTYDFYWDGIGIFGRRWLSSFDYKLLFTTDDPTSACYPRPGNGTCDPTGQSIWAQRSDGRKIKFNYATTPAPGWYEDKPSPIAKILKVGGNYQLYSEDHTVELYDATGFPVTIKNQQGIGWNFTYDGNHYLTRVTHDSGRHVDFTWSGGLLTQITDPAGNVYQYTYKTIALTSSNSMQMASTQTASRSIAPMLMMQPDLDDPPPTPTSPPIQTMVALLTGVTQPGSPSTTLAYLYEDSRFQTALTGKTIQGVRYSWFTYDANARAIETKHAYGMERYQFAYTLDTNGKVTATAITNPLGKVTTYSFDASGNQLSIDGQASTHCPASYAARQYDSNGYMSASTDFRGNITAYESDAKGQVLKVTENAGADPSAQRVRTYVWDDYNHKTKETLAGQREVTYVYGADQRLASATVKNLSSTVAASAGQTRATTYAYTTWPNGLLATMTIDGPLAGSGDATVLTYSQTGDLLSSKNGLGQTTTYDGYNNLGLPGSITGPNGEKEAYVYDGRGRVVDRQTFRNGGTQHTYYEYDGFGRLSRMTAPDGMTHSYQYDAAGRLLSEYEPEPGGTFAQTVYTYNAMSLPTSVKKQRTFVEPQRGTTP